MEIEVTGSSSKESFAMEVGGLKRKVVEEKDQVRVTRKTLQAVLEQCQRAIESISNSEGGIDDDDEDDKDDADPQGEASGVGLQRDQEVDELCDLLKSRVQCSDFLEKLECARDTHRDKKRERERESISITVMAAAAHINIEPAIPEEETTSNSLIRNTRCCFCFPCFSSRRTPAVGVAFWQRIGSSNVQSDTGFWSSSVKAFKKVREWSEIVAGPRWKTFIRRFNRSKSGSGIVSGGRHGQFRYDPLSYALNFDEGPRQNGNLEDDNDFGAFRAFSTRYASVPGSEKTPLA